MKTSRQLILKLHNQKGATAVVIAIVMAALIGIVALAIDVGYVAVTKNELQNIADAAALAGAGELGNIYQDLNYDDQQVLSLDENDVDAIKIEAKRVVGDEKNQAGGEYIDIYDGDILINKWHGTSFNIDDYDQPNAVRVIARRDSSANGPISTFFAKIFGIETLDVSADATAALTGLSEAPIIPVGISSHWIDYYDSDGICNQFIRLHPTGDLEGCAGWHTYKSWPANAAKLRQIIEDMTRMEPENYPRGAVEDEFVYIGGDVANIFDAFQALYDVNKIENNGEWEWDVILPVYDYGDVPNPCSNPNGRKKTVGFVAATITEVTGPPDPKEIKAKIVCEYITLGDGGGEDNGVLGTIPTLVE